MSTTQNKAHKLRARTAYIRQYPVRALVCLLLLVGLIALVTYVPQGAAATERATAVQSSSFSELVKNPTNTPYKLLVMLLTTFSSSILAVRAASILILCATTVALYYSLRHWHTKTVAILVSGLFVTNSFVLAVGRLGTPLVSVFGWFIFTALLLWQVHGNSNKILPGSVILAVAIMLYTPGSLWFFAVFLAFYWDRFKIAFKYVKPQSVTLGVLGALVVFGPLIYAFVQDTSLLTQWLLIPESFTVATIAESALQVPSNFIYQMRANPLLNVGMLPVFDLATGFLFLLGLYAYSKKTRLDRARLLIAVALIGLIIGSFGDHTTATVVLLPFVFSVIGAGVEYVLDMWHDVFPRNPYAKSFGVLLVSTVVLFGSYYQLTRFLVAWPQTPETKQIYDQPRIIE